MFSISSSANSHALGCSITALHPSVTYPSRLFQFIDEHPWSGPNFHTELIWIWKEFWKAQHDVLHNHLKSLLLLSTMVCKFVRVSHDFTPVCLHFLCVRHSMFYWLYLIDLRFVGKNLFCSSAFLRIFSHACTISNPKFPLFDGGSFASICVGFASTHFSQLSVLALSRHQPSFLTNVLYIADLSLHIPTTCILAGWKVSSTDLWYICEAVHLYSD